MADSTSANRKRSRSPTDTEGQGQPKESKRLNLGATPDSSDERNGEDKNGNSEQMVTSEKDGDKLSNNRQLPDGAVISAGPESAGAAGKSSVDLKDDAPPVPQTNISMRCLIVTQDASIIIGRAGAHVNEIRQKSGAKVMVSESIPGNPERILTVGGPLDAVSKV